MRPVSIGSGGLVVDDAAFAKWCDEHGACQAVVVAPCPVFGPVADSIAAAWAPTLGADKAIEAARNTVAPLAMLMSLDGAVSESEVITSAIEVLEHRRRRFGLAVDSQSCMRLAMVAYDIWRSCIPQREAA